MHPEGEDEVGRYLVPYLAKLERAGGENGMRSSRRNR